MSRQQDIEKLATKLMKWHKGRYGRFWRDSKGTVVAHDTWNPWTSWHDAGMVCEASGAASMILAGVERKSDKAKTYVCVLLYEDTHTVHADSPEGYPAATAEAALKVCDG